MPIKTAKRPDNSKINIIGGGGRFLLVIFEAGALYSPLKIFPCQFFTFTYRLLLICLYSCHRRTLYQYERAVFYGFISGFFDAFNIRINFLTNVCQK